MVNQVSYEAIDQRPLLNEYFAAIWHNGSYIGAEPFGKLRIRPQEICGLFEVAILLSPVQILNIIHLYGSWLAGHAASQN